MTVKLVETELKFCMKIMSVEMCSRLIDRTYFESGFRVSFEMNQEVATRLSKGRFFGKLVWFSYLVFLAAP